MSNEDMNLQAGKALRDYSSAKAALAHSESLLESVADQHKRVADVLQMNLGENFPSAKTILKNMGATERAAVGGVDYKLYLEDGDRLYQLLQDHEAAIKLVAATLATLRGFGFGNVE